MRWIEKIKKACLGIGLSAVLLFASGMAAFAADGVNKDVPMLLDDPAIQIQKTANKNEYTIKYKAGTETLVTNDSILLLLFNGRFIPNAKPVNKKGKVYVPTAILSQELHENVESLALPVETIDSIPYIHTRLLQDKYNLNIQFQQFSSAQTVDEKNIPVSILSIEYSPESASKEGLKRNINTSFSTQDGTNAIIHELNTHFDQQKAQNKNNPYFKSMENGFKPDDLQYSKQNLGPYYIYNLYGLDSCMILFNKYSGEIFSSYAGDSLFDIRKGVPNIGKLRSSNQLGILWYCEGVDTNGVYWFSGSLKQLLSNIKDKKLISASKMSARDFISQYISPYGTWNLVAFDHADMIDAQHLMSILQYFMLEEVPEAVELMKKSKRILDPEANVYIYDITPEDITKLINNYFVNVKLNMDDPILKEFGYDKKTNIFHFRVSGGYGSMGYDINDFHILEDTLVCEFDMLGPTDGEHLRTLKIVFVNGPKRLLYKEIHDIKK